MRTKNWKEGDLVIITETLTDKKDALLNKHIKNETMFAIVEISECECVTCEGCPTKGKTFILGMDTTAKDGDEDEFVSLCGCKLKKA